MSDDVAVDRERLAPFVRHDRDSYGGWAVAAGLDTGHRPVDDPHGLWDDPEHWVLTPGECVELIDELGPGVTMPISPMMGGIPPELGRESLHRIVEQVMPSVR